MKRAFLCTTLGLIVACGSSGNGGGTKSLPAPDDFMDDIRSLDSCVFTCDPACQEGSAPLKCPALDDWSKIPHDPDACGSFDGKTYPTPQKGACTATDPTGDALTKTTSTGTPVVLPDGRKLEPAGNEWVLDDIPGGFPASSLLVPGTKWWIVADVGYFEHALRAVDSAAAKTPSAMAPIASTVKTDTSHALNWGITYSAVTKRIYAPSGNLDPRVHSYTFDAATGTIAEDAAKAIPLPDGSFPQCVDVSPDGKTMLVGLATDSKVLVVSLDDATYGMVKSEIDTVRTDVYSVAFDPTDPSGNTAYATLWRGAIDVGDPTKMIVLELDLAKSASHVIAVGKSPEGMAFLDARYLAVATGLADEIAIIDRPAGTVATKVSLGGAGYEPTSLAWDAPHKRLYATLASTNAVAVFNVDTSQSPPQVSLGGMIPTGWWPTSVVVDPNDGALFITNGRGHGTKGLASPDTGPPSKVVHNDTSNSHMLRGSLEVVPFVDDATLATMTAQVQKDGAVQSMDGYPTVQCNGAPYDFPLPQKPEDGPSTKIKHVFYIVRENKTFDGVMGDVKGLDGEPSYILAPGYQDVLWQNARKWASEFAQMDNFYLSSEQSEQGHFWSVYGRTDDVEERRWLVTWGRGEFSTAQSPGVGDTDTPVEGSVFEFLQNQGVQVENDGELIGGFGSFRNTHWNGGTSDSFVPDILPACYLAGRSRVLCNPAEFTYIWFGNDHTFGLRAGAPSPPVMISTNDEATGMFLDGLSHSPAWQDSLVVVVEDDPSDGQDHVDEHRSIALFASPWIKRSYVSHGHYDITSVHKLVSLVFGKPYRNRQIADAPLPFDMFTSTPDYTPFNYVPRAYSDLTCNPKDTAGAHKARGWDFTRPDDQPGLDEQVREALHSLPPRK